MNPLADRTGGGRQPEQEGWRARLAGQAPSDCPYLGGPEADAWRSGWDEEDRLLGWRCERPRLAHG